jgi:serine/threonine protein kinase
LQISLCRFITNVSQEKYSFVLRKRFSPDFNDPEGYVTRLTREREALRDLNHPNIVKFLAYDEEECHDAEDDQWYRESRIYMEYCEGGDLRKYVKPRRQSPFNDLQSSKLPSLTPHETWSILADLASALAYCHHGLFKDEAGNYSLKEEWEPRLHRDIKPENSEGPRSQYRLLKNV